MTTGYQLTETPSEVIRLSDGARVVMPPEDSEMFAYAQWLAAGNVPLPWVPEVPEVPMPSIGYVTPEQFGAVGDGVTDDHAAITLAVASNMPVVFRPVSYRISAAIVLPAGGQLLGVERKTTMVVDAGAHFVDVRGGNTVVQGFVVDCRAGSGAGVFQLRTDLSHVNRCFIRNIESKGAMWFLRDADGPNMAVYIKVENCVASVHRGPGVLLRDAFAYLKLSHVTIDYVGSASRNHVAFSFTKNEGAQLEYCDVTGGQVDATTAGAHGFLFTNCVAVWMSNCMADTVGGVGFFLFGGCRHFYLSQCVSSLVGNHGFAIEGSGGASSDIQITNCLASGRRGQPYAPAGASGFALSASGTQITGCRSMKNTGNGFVQYGVGAQSTLNGCQARDNGAFGLSAQVGSLIASGLLTVGNVSGNYSLASNIQHIAASQAASGAFVSVTGPAAA
jgi:Right handed beta helix region